MEIGGQYLEKLFRIPIFSMLQHDARIKYANLLIMNVAIKIYRHYFSKCSVSMVQFSEKCYKLR